MGGLLTDRTDIALLAGAQSPEQVSPDRVFDESWFIMTKKFWCSPTRNRDFATLLSLNCVPADKTDVTADAFLRIKESAQQTH